MQQIESQMTPMMEQEDDKQKRIQGDAIHLKPQRKLVTFDTATCSVLNKIVAVL